MILPDSSIWIHHIRKTLPGLNSILEDGQVFCHPFITGEVALGSLANRERTIAKLAALPQFPVQRHERVAYLIESAELFGCGVDYIDVHLLASALMVPGTRIWTSDKRFHAGAERLGIAYEGAAL